MKQNKLFVLLLTLLMTISCGKAPVITPQPPTDNPAPIEQPNETFDIDISRIDGSTATIPLTQAGLTALTGSFEGLIHNKTDIAYELLFEGEKDVIFVTYPSEEELQMAKERGIELEIVPVVKDALVFLTNAENSVTDITSEQIKGIYSGEITNWNEIGGDNADIIPFQRPVNSGSQTLFLKLAMEGITPIDAPDTFKPAGMDNLVDAVANYDYGRYSLGFSVFYYATAMYLRDTAKLAAIDGVMPTAKTIASGEYKYLTYYYAVYNKNLPKDNSAYRFAQWFLTEAGQKTALQAGYVPLADIQGEKDNLVYGYYGSTPANTAHSVGTGGTEYIGSYNDDALSYANGTTWNNDAATNRITDYNLEGYPLASKAVSEWFKNVYPGKRISCDLYYSGDLISAVATYMEDDIDYFKREQEYAVFNAKTGKELALSDLFYDGVNYIGFINKNLFTEAYPMAPIDGPDLMSSFDEKSVLRPFTGIPDDYDKFFVSKSDRGVHLFIYFDYDNPFFLIDGDFMTPYVNLPADLSPYSSFWKIDYKSERPTPQIKAAVPQIKINYLTDSETDKRINAALMSMYEDMARSGAFEEYALRIGLPPAADIVFAPETSLWGNYFTAAYQSSPFYGLGEPSRVISIVTVDLTTGDIIDTDFLRGELKGEWWNRSAKHTKDGEYIEGDYTMPDVYELKYFRKTSYGGLVFCIVSPDDVVTVQLLT